MRSNVNNWLRQNGISGQKQIRRASWRHSELYLNDLDYKENADQLYTDIGQIPCSMSQQESYHMSHLVGAIMLILLRPDKAIRLNKQQPISMAVRIAKVSDDEAECTTYKNVLYDHLWEVIRNYGKSKQKKSKNESNDLYDHERRILRIERFLKERFAEFDGES